MVSRSLLTRRTLLGCAVASLPFAVTGVDAAGALEVTDMLGRTVSLDGKPGRIVFLDARDVLCIGFLDPEPMRYVAGWSAPEMFDSDAVLEALTAGEAGEIPVVGGQAPGSVSVEAIVALKPDLIVTTGHIEDGNPGLAEQLGGFDLPVIFSDSATGRSGKGAEDDTARLITMWGRLLGREAQAQAYLEFVDKKLAAVSGCVANATEYKIYLEVQSTYDDCCWAAGTDVWGELLARAGGRVPDAVSSPWFQKLHVEQLITEQPEVYIATGGAFASGMRPAIGPGLPSAEARLGLERLVARNGLQNLSAVQRGNVHGVWTGLITIRPLNILFVELAAKWLHPDQCQTIDPQKTLQELNERFLSAPIEGPLWASLNEEEHTEH